MVYIPIIELLFFSLVHSLKKKKKKTNVMFKALRSFLIFIIMSVLICIDDAVEIISKPLVFCLRKGADMNPKFEEIIVKTGQVS